MNEGWASFWHERIMQRLFSEGFLSADEHGFYNLYNARVKSHNPRSINPYLLGCAMFRDVERRWDTGRHGRAYEEASPRERLEWDTGAMAGREKLFQVRRTHLDWFFVDEFLSKDVVDELELYVYREAEQQNSIDMVVDETEWERVKRFLVVSLMNWGVPQISVIDGDYRRSRQLYLRHAYEGFPLQEDYARKTLEHVHFLWGRPVHLETQEPANGKTRGKLYTADERGVQTRID
jgi:stage V sporulation protein R